MYQVSHAAIGWNRQFLNSSKGQIRLKLDSPAYQVVIPKIEVQEIARQEHESCFAYAISKALRKYNLQLCNGLLFASEKRLASRSALYLIDRAPKPFRIILQKYFLSFLI